MIGIFVYAVVISAQTNFLSGLGSKSELRRAGAIENNELRLEEDVAINGEPDAGVGLDTTEASCRIVSQLCFLMQVMGRELTCASGGGVVYVRAWYDGLVGSDAESDAGEGCRAGKSISTLRADVLSTRYLGIVGGDGCLWEIK